jgi:translation initiation factor 2 beta subunit (eIF-2beta)/eIF-5
MIRNAPAPLSHGAEAAWIERMVQTNILDNWESQDEPEHLRTIRDRLLGSKQSELLLALYRQILERESMTATNSKQERELLLSGLVVNRQGNLAVNNRIYRSIFDLDWLTRHNP